MSAHGLLDRIQGIGISIAVTAAVSLPSFATAVPVVHAAPHFTKTVRRNAPRKASTSGSGTAPALTLGFPNALPAQTLSDLGLTLSATGPCFNDPYGNWTNPDRTPITNGQQTDGNDTLLSDSTNPFTDTYFNGLKPGCDATTLWQLPTQQGGNLVAPGNSFAVSTVNDQTPTSPALGATFTPTSSPAISNLTISDSAASGGQGRNWVVNFTAGAAAPGAQFSTITISGPNGTQFSSSNQYYTVTINGTQDTGATETLLASNEVLVTTSTPIPSNASVSVSAVYVSDPADGTYANTLFTAYTSDDPAPVHPATGMTFSQT